MGYRVSQAHLDEIARSGQVDDHLHMIADAGAEGARDEAPKETGRLAGSYGSERMPGEPGWRFGNTNYPVDYVDEVEFGTATWDGHPHLRTAGVEAARAAARRGSRG